MNCSRKKDQSILQEGLRADSIGYMPGLDGLRALAVLAVIVYHLNPDWAPGGLLGVSLFFVLSGYLITNILLTQWEQTGRIDLRDFWLRRARRLLPALFVMLAGVLTWSVLFAPERLTALKQEVLAAIFYISNWYLIFHQVSYFEQFGPPSPLGHLWSLAVEEQFYLFWPLLLGLGLRWLPQRKWIIGGTAAVALASVIAMALIYMPGQDPSRVYYGTDTRASALLVGALLAMILPSRKMAAGLSGGKRLAIDTAGAMGLLAVLIMMVKTNQYQASLYHGGLMLYSLASACLVAALAHPAGSLSRLFGWRPLRWLGKCSYGIYLWHYPVIVLTSPAVETEGPNIGRMLLQIAASIALAALSRRLIEDPIRYGRKHYRRLTTGFPQRHRPLALSAKISANILLVFLILFLTVNHGIPTSAENLKAGELSDDPVQIIAAPAPENQPLPAGSDQVSDLKGDDITAIGDSLMINVAPVLQERLPGIVIDSKIGRQMYEAPDIIFRLKREGKLGKTVIIALGTNGSFTEKQLTETLDALKGTEEIVLVNTRVPRPWESVVNETLTQISECYPNTKLIDWYSASSGHDDYFCPDGVHLDRTGAEAYSQLLVNNISCEIEESMI